VKQGEGEVELLARTAGEVLDAVVEVLGERQFLEQLLARMGCRRVVEVVGLREETEVLVDRELVPKSGTCGQ
jgi:hypothetical protein